MTRPAFLGRARRRWPLLAASLLVPALGITFIGVGGTDDSYITLDAARQLANSGALLNVNGERIEQSSSLLHVIILAIAYRITHIPLPWLAWGIGILAGMATVVVVGLLADRVRSGSALLASALTALSTPFLYWSVGSLETPIAALLLTSTAFTTIGALASTERRAWRRLLPPGIAILLFSMVRPEGSALLLLAFAIAFVALHRVHHADPVLRRRTGRRLFELSVIAALGVRSIDHRAAAMAVIVPSMLIGGAVHLSAESQGEPIWRHPVWIDSGTAQVAMPWVESQSRAHLADVTAAHTLAGIVEALDDPESQPVRVGSMQAGALVFHSRSTEGARFRFLDTLSLTTDEFSACPSNGNHTRKGFAVGLSPWFAGRDICGVSPPDALLLLYCAPLEADPSTHTIVWRTGGRFEPGALHGAGPTDQCIAVRNDRLDALPPDLRPPPN